MSTLFPIVRYVLQVTLVPTFEKLMWVTRPAFDVDWGEGSRIDRIRRRFHRDRSDLIIPERKHPLTVTMKQAKDLSLASRGLRKCKHNVRSLSLVRVANQQKQIWEYTVPNTASMEHKFKARDTTPAQAGQRIISVYLPIAAPPMLSLVKANGIEGGHV